MVRGFLILAGLLLFLPNLARAGEIVQEPICFLVANDTDFTIFGSLNTDYYTRPDGIKTRHRSNFRLEKRGTVHEEEGYPLDRAEFCSYGPFYEGRKLDFVIRTLFPVFSCRTNIESGPIVISATPREDDPMGGYDYSATCYE